MTDNMAIWFRSLLDSWNLESAIFLVKYVVYRSFSPFGFILACGILVRDAIGRSLLARLGIVVLAALVILGRKAHHEYDWLAIAPIVALGAAKGLEEGWVRGLQGRIMSVSAGFGLAIASVVLAAPTWRTPPEWSDLRIAVKEIRSRVPNDAMIVAPEALLFESDRRGARLEFEPNACRTKRGGMGRNA